MVLRIRIQKAADHALVLGVVALCFALKKLHTALAKCNRDLYPFFPEDKVFRVGKEIRDDLKPSEGFVAVLDFRAHKLAYLSANSLRQIPESLYPDT